MTSDISRPGPASKYVANETPTGTINGSNTSFTVANACAKMINVVLDGLEYFNFTITAGTTTLTLTDAPTTSLTVDYFKV